MSAVLINSTSDTFTPTKSGAIATCVWELCRAAGRASGVEPWVITRSTDAAPYDWRKTILLDYPRIPRFRGAFRLLDAQRRLTGWGELRQKAYAVRVAGTIRKAGLEGLPMILNNDVELAVFLRRCFPDATIIHHFHNANQCSERFRRQLAGAVTAATAVSNYIRDWAQEYFGFDQKSVKTIYNGVDSERFSPATKVPDGPPVINFVGRTDSAKAPDLILRAAKLLASSTTDFAIQILGARFYWGSEPDEYQTRIESLSDELQRNGITVRRPGLVSRAALPGELRKAHIHVVPSRWDEPCALTIFEGMASGLATIGSRTGGTPEIIGQAGLLFGRDSVEGLADHLRHLLLNRDVRIDYATRARQRAESFTWKKTWSQFEALMDGAAPGKRSDSGRRSASSAPLKAALPFSAF
jgi:glycosyltransferase involved in cell wall biosynthesis